MTIKEQRKQVRIKLASMVIEYLNEKADRKFRYDSRGTLKLFTAEWSHRYGVEQYRGVVDYLVLRWKNDPKMEAYLRPVTLFGPEKFPEYLAEARSLIISERKKKRLQSFKSYRPVFESDDRKLKPFNEYDPAG